MMKWVIVLQSVLLVALLSVGGACYVQFESRRADDSRVIADAQAELERLTDQLNEARTSLAEVAAELSTANEQGQELRAAHDLTLAELAVANERITQLAQRLDKADADRRSLEQRLVAAKSSSEECAARLHDVGLERELAESRAKQAVAQRNLLAAFA